MVTSNKSLENKAVTMSDNSASNSGPPRTLLGEVNPHLTCVLCHGYYIDATTIVECLHSFCRSCIIKHLQTKSYCPVCEMMINSARPNIKPDKALQDIVYKLVPGLFQREMERRQLFYASHPGPAASATPEQRGEDTERIIFSPEDVISFSLEYIDSTETDSASSKSSESGNDIPNSSGVMTRRYLQCPAVVNISHLKKFLSMKFDIDLSQYCIDILYKRLPLPDYYTLIDVAYIYNWKRIEPMRFFYQIIDFSAIRNRFGLFGINRISHLRKRKRPSALNIRSVSPIHGLLDPSSDGSSGANSPLPDDALPVEKINQVENDNDHNKNICEGRLRSSKILEVEKSCSPGIVKNVQSPPPDEEKSQFLNSFELTAKSKLSPSPVKSLSSTSGALETVQSDEINGSSKGQHADVSNLNIFPGNEIGAKRKLTLENENSTKKTKGDDSKQSPVKKDVKIEDVRKPDLNVGSIRPNFSPKKSSDALSPNNKIVQMASLPRPPPNLESKKESEVKQSLSKVFIKNMPKNQNFDEKKLNSGDSSFAIKRPIPSSIKLNQGFQPKRKLSGEANSHMLPSKANQPNTQQKIQSSEPLTTLKSSENCSLVQNKIENKMATTADQIQPKVQVPLNKPNTKPGTPQSVLEPIHDVKQSTSSNQHYKNALTTHGSGDPLKSLFDSCNINIPSSLSITLTDQKMEQKHSEGVTASVEQKKHPHKVVATMASNLNNPAKTPSPPVHNYIEILKLPEVDSSKKVRNESSKSATPSKPNDPPTSAKGPVPNLKPISETKSKSVTFTKPQTFQQTFLQSLQKQRHTEKTKIIKNKLTLPKAAPGIPSSISPDNEQSPNGGYSHQPQNPSKSGPSNNPIPDTAKTLPNLVKSDSALDLSTPHLAHNPLALQQTKALETMQSIANLAKKQNYTQKGPSQSLQSCSFISANSKNTTQSQLRIPIATNQGKQAPVCPPTTNSATDSPRHLAEYFQPLKTSVARGNESSPVQGTKPVANQNTNVQPLRAQTRSPSSSPKLVIACPSPKSQSPEEKQLVSPNILDNLNQSNQISSSQISSTNATAGESSGSKEAPKVTKQLVPASNSSKLTNIRLPNQKLSTSTSASPTDLLHHFPSQVIAQQAYIRHQLELQNQFGLLHPGAAAQWFQLNNNSMARTHFENIMKSMTHNVQNPFNNHHKDGKS